MGKRGKLKLLLDFVVGFGLVGCGIRDCCQNRNPYDL